MKWGLGSSLNRVKMRRVEIMSRCTVKIASVMLVGGILMGIGAVEEVGAQLKPQPLKVGIVNSEVLMENYPQFRRAQEQLEREMAGWQKEREAWIKDMEGRQAVISEKEKQLEIGQTTFTEKRKKELKNEIDSLKVDLQERYNRQLNFEQERLQKRRAELIGEVLETVNGVIQEVGKDEGYDLIIDAANGTVIYARDPQDLTDKILQRLQKR